MRYKTQFSIDLTKLKSNFEKLKKLAPKNQILFMVKANAYGHGDLVITRFAIEQLDIKEFGFASLGEALTAREHLSDLEFEAYVFSDTEFRDKTELYIENRITPVISKISDLEHYFSIKEQSSLPLVIKLNTGMNRLGIPAEQLDQIISLLKSNGKKSIDHLMTHFANSYYPVDNKRFQYQYNEFQKAKKNLLKENIDIKNSSAANSGAIEQGVGLDEETHIRPGLMVYGPSSLLDPYSAKWDGEIVTELKSNVIEHFSIKKGTPIGYGSTPCPRDGELAIAAIGYGDGILNAFRGAKVYLKKDGKEVSGEIVGRVNMDMIQVLFPSGTNVNYDDQVIVWDSNKKHFFELCEKTKLIPYEVFLQISLRVPKVYI